MEVMPRCLTCNQHVSNGALRLEVTPGEAEGLLGACGEVNHGVVIHSNTVIQLYNNTVMHIPAPHPANKRAKPGLKTIQTPCVELNRIYLCTDWNLSLRAIAEELCFLCSSKDVV